MGFSPGHWCLGFSPPSTPPSAGIVGQRRGLGGHPRVADLYGFMHRRETARIRGPVRRFFFRDFCSWGWGQVGDRNCRSFQDFPVGTEPIAIENG